MRLVQPGTVYQGTTDVSSPWAPSSRTRRIVGMTPLSARGPNTSHVPPSMPITSTPPGFIGGPPSRRPPLAPAATQDALGVRGGGHEVPQDATPPGIRRQGVAEGLPGLGSPARPEVRHPQAVEPHRPELRRASEHVGVLLEDPGHPH